MHEDATIRCLEEQVDCYRRLARLAELQHIHIEQSQTEQLIEVLNSRQGLLDRISILEKTVAPARQRWSEYLRSVPPDARGTADSLLAESVQLLEQITTADRNDVLVLQQRKLNLGRQIQQAQSARSVNRSYVASAYGTQKSNMDVQR